MRAALRMLPIPGALLGREMRGTSRQARFYAMRFAYVAMLGLYLAAIWVAVTDYLSDDDGALSIVRMADAGKYIAASVANFQFYGAQIAAAVLLSTAISGEIARGTLPLLLASPIPRRQIVLDKLLGGVLHVGVLVGISFPVLALVRVFGGVPWGFVLAGACVTLTSAAFVGALAVYFSARFRWPQATVAVTGAAVVTFYYVVGPLLGLFVRGVYGSLLPGGVALFSPPRMMNALLTDLLLPRGSTGISGVWPLHCLAMYAATLLVLRGARGMLAPSRRREAATARRRARQNDLPALSLAAPARGLSGGHHRGALADVTGSPILWKDLRRPWILQRRHGLFAVCFSAVLLVFLYLIMLNADGMRSWEAHLTFIAIYLILICANTAVLAPSSIAYEKETRGWTVLLTTPLSDWHIVMAKLYGAWYRGRFLWVVLGLHVGISGMAGLVNPLLVLYLGVLSAAFFLLTAGVGMLMGALCKRSHWAIFLTFVVVLGLAVIVPVVAELVCTLARVSSHRLGTTTRMLLDPVGLVVEVVRNAEHHGPISSAWSYARSGLRELATPVSVLSFLYALAGAGCIFEARRRLRRSA